VEEGELVAGDSAASAGLEVELVVVGSAVQAGLELEAVQGRALGLKSRGNG
jgi:hypothetical protein